MQNLPYLKFTILISRQKYQKIDITLADFEEHTSVKKMFGIQDLNNNEYMIKVMNKKIKT